MDVVASISDRMGDLGGYLREQREHARLSVRQLASLAGVSNPYLSQVERGLRRPSAEVLQQIARGLRISAEALYVRAGILDEEGRPGVEAAVHADPDLNERQRRVLLDIYASFRAENRRAAEEEPEPEPERVVVRRRVPSGASRRAVDESPVDESPVDDDAPTPSAPVQPDVDEPDAVRPSAASRPQRATRKAATAKKSATATKGATAKKAVTATKTTTARRSAAVRRTPAGQAPAEQAAEQATTEQATDDRTPDTEGGPSDGRS